MLPSEAMLKASELIKECGWIQGDLGSREAGYCLDGAIATAHGWPGDFDGVSYDRTRATLTRATQRYHKLGPILFNDTRGRTREEVLEVLRLAAIEAAKEEARS